MGFQHIEDDLSFGVGKSRFQAVARCPSSSIVLVVA
jgi:hypothetical protein